MFISIRTVAALIAVTLMQHFLFAADQAKPLVFNTTSPTNDLEGTLSAHVRFAQSQIIPAHPGKGDTQPRRRSSSRLIMTTAAVAVISLFALSIVSKDFMRSKWTGPMAVMMAMSGGHHDTSSAISPGPYVPISATKTDVPGVRFSFIARDNPARLLKLLGLATREMS